MSTIEEEKGNTPQVNDSEPVFLASLRGHQVGSTGERGCMILK